MSIENKENNSEKETNEFVSEKEYLKAIHSQNKVIIDLLEELVGKESDKLRTLKDIEYNSRTPERKWAKDNGYE